MANQRRRQLRIERGVGGQRRVQSPLPALDQIQRWMLLRKPLRWPRQRVPFKFRKDLPKSCAAQEFSEFNMIVKKPMPDRGQLLLLKPLRWPRQRVPFKFRKDLPKSCAAQEFSEFNMIVKKPMPDRGQLLL